MKDLKEFNKKIQDFKIKEYKGGKRFINGDTIMARITPCLENGKTAYVDILNDNEIGFGSTEFIVLRGKEKKTTNEFVYYLTISPDIRKKAIKSMTGTSGRQRVQKEIFDKIKILLPPVQEQKAIANILSTLDKKIEINNQINETLEEMAQAIYKSWFVDFEPFQEGNFVESELGMIPEGWDVKKIKELGKVVLGKTPSTRKKENYGNKYPFIKIPDMHNKMYVTKTEKMLSEIGHKTQEKKLIPQNSVSVSCIGTVGLVTLNSVPSHTNQQINSIVCEDYLTEYLYFTMKNMKKTLNKMGSGGTTIGNINKGTFQKIKIIKPSDTVLQKYNNVVKPLFKNIKENLFQNQTLKKLRDTLLPKLMSGEIRVPQEE